MTWKTRKPSKAERQRLKEREGLSPENLVLLDHLRQARGAPVDPALEAPVCRACGGTNVRFAAYPDTKSLFFANMSVLCCPDCGIAYVPTRPHGLDYYYRHLYSIDKRRPTAPEPEALWSGAFDKKLAVARSQQHIDIAKDALGSIDVAVDIGAGYGTTLRMSGAKTRIAVEIDHSMHRYLDHIGAERHDSTRSLDSGIADVVFSSHYLEHLYIDDMAAQLAEIMRLLRPGGIAVIEVPNAALLSFGAEGVWHAPHLIFFTAQSLRQMAERSGAASVEIRPAGKDPRPLISQRLHTPAPEDDIRHGALLALLRKAT